MKYMEDNHTVSIIVPIYNAGAYLDECVKSIIEQTYSNIEILLINDGSTDNSSEICRKWHNVDKRIKVYDNENRGVSYTRNFGLENCTGEYITFVDSDDLIGADYVKTLVDTIEDADMSIVSYSCFYEGQQVNFTNEDTTTRFYENFEECFYTITHGVVWCKLFKANIITSNHISFTTDIAINEDLLFNFEYLKYCKSLAYNKSKLYGYRQRNNSAIHNTASSKWFDCLKAYKFLFENYKDNSSYPYIVFYYLKNLYEAEYIIKSHKVYVNNLTRLQADIKTAEKEIGVVSPKKRIKLLMCKYFFPIIRKIK